jgi:hypothetical protein
MASGNKKRTTMAKLNRENKLREKRQDKAARKEARKRAAANPVDPFAERELEFDAETGDDEQESEDAAAPAQASADA